MKLYPIPLICILLFPSTLWAECVFHSPNQLDEIEEYFREQLQKNGSSGELHVSTQFTSSRGTLFLEEGAGKIEVSWGLDGNCRPTQLSFSGSRPIWMQAINFQEILGATPIGRINKKYQHNQTEEHLLDKSMAQKDQRRKEIYGLVLIFSVLFYPSWFLSRKKSLFGTT